MITKITAYVSYFLPLLIAFMRGERVGEYDDVLILPALSHVQVSFVETKTSFVTALQSVVLFASIVAPVEYQKQDYT